MKKNAHQADERDVVEVTWEDCAGSHGWQNAKDIPQPIQIKSVGYVVQDDAIALIICEGLTDRDAEPGNRREYGCASTIPRSQVRGMKVIRRARK